jgi:hypothetical protein
VVVVPDPPPAPDPDDEEDDTFATVKFATLLPVTWPGVWSDTNVYNSEPLYVTWSVPFACRDVPSVPVTPDPAVGVVPDATVSAGHAWAHAPVQALCPPWSPPKVYSAMPVLLTSTVPKVEFWAVFTVALEVPEVADVLEPEPEPAPVVDELDAEFVGDELHAAARIATVATAPSAVALERIRRGRVAPRSRRAGVGPGDCSVVVSVLLVTGCPSLDESTVPTPGRVHPVGPPRNAAVVTKDTDQLVPMFRTRHLALHGGAGVSRYRGRR